MPIVADNLEFLDALALTNPKFKLVLDRALAKSYSDFISVLYRDLEEIINQLQSRKQFLCNALEDVITVQIVDALIARNYRATHDTKQGGHIDIFVEGNDPNWQWLGEAKRCYKGNDWFEKGFRQLCQRYADGGYNHDHGGLIVYVQRKNAKTIFEEWGKYIPNFAGDFNSMSVADCPNKIPLRLITTHNHETSGLPYTVKHFFIPLYHKPTV